VNTRRQRRVLYREFLFRVVDRELFSSHAKGDASQLLLQIVALLVCLSALVSLPAVFVDAGPQAHGRLLLAWSAEHFLIATTMLVVGVFAVLGWGSMFPDQRDVLVLAPLPVRAHTILLAKIAALGTALGATVLALHAVAGVVWPLVLSTSSRPYTIPALTSDPALPPVGPADLQAVLDRDFGAAVREGALSAGGGAGVSIAVSTRGTRQVFSYGAATPDSVFHIASVGKVFTGLALAHMIEEGVVRLAAPVRELIPGAGLARPADGRPEITLRDLVTHESGLPPMPVDFRPRDPANPFADFDAGRLHSFLAARGVARSRAGSFRYSNVGYGLLGHALAVRAGVDYEGLVRQRITAPLGMMDTSVALSADQERRLMPGHDRDHRPVRRWDVGEGVAGAGALMSTAPDLLTWLEANLHPERVPAGLLSDAIRASQQRLTGVTGDAGLAFGWFLTPAGDFVHAGDTVGVSAIVSFNPSKDRAFVVLSNTQRGTSISADLVAEHLRARLDGSAPIAIADLTIPADRGASGSLRRYVAYWVTMAAAGLFMFGLTVSLQGLAAALLPHRYFLRVSSVLQLGVFCTLIAGFFLQPMVVSGMAIVDAQHAPFTSSPSYWFLGLFQALNGSPALAALAGQALVGLAVVVVTATGVCALSYVRTLKRLAEEPDIAPAIQAARRLPSFGSALQTAVVHFSARTLFRSAQHRVIFAFYLGIGVALSAVLLKAPRARELADEAGGGAWDERSMPFIVSSIVMMVCAIVGARLTFAMPRDLAANWIFRVLPVRGGARYAAARRRTLLALAAGPVWALSAGVFLAQWPLLPAAGHLIILALVGATLVELCLSGTQGIPFTCAYLPGQSRSNLSVPAAIVMLLLLVLVIADVERRALEEPIRYAAIIGVLAIAWIAARWRTSWLASGVPEPEFEDEPADRILSLEVWDTRLSTLPDKPVAAARD
jgi:CubicO group peptidase (beta-lactamase class C family)